MLPNMGQLNTFLLTKLLLVPEQEHNAQKHTWHMRGNELFFICFKEDEVWTKVAIPSAISIVYYTLKYFFRFEPVTKSEPQSKQGTRTAN